MTKGYLAVVLHAHLPYVRYGREENRLEERWLFEAITETYIPLLQAFTRLIHDHIHFQMTISMTPTLLAMLTDRLLQSRYKSYLNNLIELAKKEVIRTKENEQLNRLSCLYVQRFEEIYQVYIECNCNLVGEFRRLQDDGYLDIMTSSATHAFLPILLTEEALRAQIAVAVQSYTHHFGRKPSGIWLPECGYAPGVDKVMSEFGLRYFVGAPQLVSNSIEDPNKSVPSTVCTSSNIIAFIRDSSSAEQVWSSITGYPGDAVYREFYRDIGYELMPSDLFPFVLPGGIQVDTGIKYFRITGASDEKQIYNPDDAIQKAKMDARDFLNKRQTQIEQTPFDLSHPPIIVTPYDAELFGHWWYEGPFFIEQVIREAHAISHLQTISLQAYVNRFDAHDGIDMKMSSWGRGGYADVWLNETNDWVIPELHRAEQKMIELAHQYQKPSPLENRALNQAARELMLAQSSDFPFMLDEGSMVQFASSRLKRHIGQFHFIAHMLCNALINEFQLSEIEEDDCIFPEMNYQLYQTTAKEYRTSKKDRTTILMLAWEFPPRVIGGLARHVYALSTHLAALGFEIHVVTAGISGSPEYEQIKGVHVHRVDVLEPHGNEFLHWVFQLNLGMIRVCRALYSQGIRFHVVHAHDWLVHTSAQMVCSIFACPLVATIHATEFGRNQGIHSKEQKQIHHTEYQLSKRADRMIVCSSYMKDEVCKLFGKESEHVAVIPNGIECTLQVTPSKCEKGIGLKGNRQTVVFIGRLVREKGVHILIDAASQVLQFEPNTKFIIAGDGPMSDNLAHQVANLNLQEAVQFVGFVDGTEKVELFEKADIAVFPSTYEPFGIVVLEAMAAHVPVVTTGVGGLADIVQHGHNGVLVHPGDASSLAQGILYVLRTPQIRKTLAQQAFADLGRYDWLDIAKRTVEVYADIPGMSYFLSDVNDQNTKIRYTIGT